MRYQNTCLTPSPARTRNRVKKKRVRNTLPLCRLISFSLKGFFFFLILIRPLIVASRTCIINSKDVHYHFQGPELLFVRTCIFTCRTYIIATGIAFTLPGPALSLSGLASLLPDMYYFAVTFPSRKVEKTKGKEPN